jgi:hypothetical protein
LQPRRADIGQALDSIFQLTRHELPAHAALRDPDVAECPAFVYLLYSGALDNPALAARPSFPATG